MEEYKESDNGNQEVEKIENKVTPPAEKESSTRSTTVRKPRELSDNKVTAAPVTEKVANSNNEVENSTVSVEMEQSTVVKTAPLDKKSIKKLKAVSDKTKEKEKKAKKKKKEKAKKEKVKKKLKEKKAKKKAVKKKKKSKK